jgi:hypothetical protein
MNDDVSFVVHRFVSYEVIIRQKEHLWDAPVTVRQVSTHTKERQTFIKKRTIALGLSGI